MKAPGKRFRSTLLLLLAALTFGGFAAFSARGYIQSEIGAFRASLEARYSPAKVIVATQSLPAGSELTADRVAIREVPREFLHRDAIAVADWARITTRRTRHMVTAGAPILRSQLTGASGGRFADGIDEGLRALTFPVDQVSSISGMLAPGDHIDILVSLRTSGEPLLMPLMKNTAVVATGEQTDPQALERQRFGTVTVMATPEQSARILYAQEVGSIRVVLRGTGDLSDSWPERMTLARLLGQPEPRPAAPRRRPTPVDVILGGGR